MNIKTKFKDSGKIWAIIEVGTVTQMICPACKGKGNIVIREKALIFEEYQCPKCLGEKKVDVFGGAVHFSIERGEITNIHIFIENGEVEIEYCIYFPEHCLMVRVPENKLAKRKMDLVDYS